MRRSGQKREALSEQALGALVVKHLEEQGWTVYQEVYLNNVADIVVTRETRNGATLIGVVELKTSLSIALLAQGASWKRYAHVVWIAFPVSRETRSQQFGEQLAKDNGIGTLHVNSGGAYEYVPPELRRKIDKKLLKALRPEHQQGFAKAGSAGGGHYTPFKGTVMRLQEVVRQQPGIPLKEALLAAKHHYSKTSVAISCISGYLKKGVIQGIVERIDEQGKITLHPVCKSEGPGGSHFGQPPDLLS